MQWLLDSGDFVPRGECGDWSPFWFWLYVTSNWLIAASYVGLFVLLVASWYFGPQSRNTIKIIIWFGAFILLCGLGHFEGAWLAWEWPNYRVFALWHSLTAGVSAYTLFLMADYLRKARTDNGW